MNGVGPLIRRLEACKTLEELQARWGGVAFAYQRLPEVIAAKDRMKEKLTGRMGEVAT